MSCRNTRRVRALGVRFLKDIVTSWGRERHIDDDLAAHTPINVFSTTFQFAVDLEQRETVPGTKGPPAPD